MQTSVVNAEMAQLLESSIEKRSRQGISRLEHQPARAVRVQDRPEM